MAIKWKALIIHHSASAQTTTMLDVDRWHRQRGFSGIGYHFFMQIRGGRGYLKAARPATLAGAHTIGWNSKALGLCIAGNYETDIMSKAIYQDVLAAAAHICKKYGIPANKVFGHRDKAATACPGKNFPLDKLKKDLESKLAS